MAEDPNVLRKLLVASKRGTADGPRAEAISAIADMCADNAKKEQFWKDKEGVLAALLGAINPAGQPEPARQGAIRALCHLATHPQNRQPMWDEVEVREIFVAAAAAGQPAPQRELAVSALAAMAQEPDLAQPMWYDAKGARAAFVSAAAKGEPDALRNHAVRALADLVNDKANQMTLWASDGVRAVLVAAAAPSEANEWIHAYAVRALSTCPLSDRQIGGYVTTTTAAENDRVLRTLPQQPAEPPGLSRASTL